MSKASIAHDAGGFRAPLLFATGVVAGPTTPNGFVIPMREQTATDARRAVVYVFDRLPRKAEANEAG